MPGPRVDYDQIAESFDVGRELDEPTIDTWVGLVEQYGRTEPDQRLLDLGCGVGRFAIPFTHRLGLEVTGADNSRVMLDIARAKEGGNAVRWELQDADKLRYLADDFHVVFMSHLLHHVDLPSAVIYESFRVLRPMGAILVRYGAMEDIAGDVEHRFFEGATEIDAASTLTTEGTEDLLRAKGFIDVASTKVNQQVYRSPADRIERVRQKFTSVLHKVTQEAFDKGIREMEAYAAEHPDDPWLVEDTITLSAGYKPDKPTR